MFQYYRCGKSKDDPWWVRALVLVPWLLGSGHQAIVMNISYYYFILNYANPIALLNGQWFVPAMILVTGAVTSLTDGFFAMKIWEVKCNRMLAAICILVIVAHTGASFAYFIQFYTPQNTVAKQNKMGTWAFSVGAATNVIVCGTMMWCLSFKAATTGKRSPMTNVERLAVLAVSTCLLTTVFEIASLIVFVAAPSLLYELEFQIIVCKLYINAVLTLLNSRTYAWKAHDGGVVDFNSLALHSVNGIYGIDHDSRGHAKSSTESESMEGAVGIDLGADVKAGELV